MFRWAHRGKKTRASPPSDAAVFLQISEQLKALHTPPAMAPKRIKRLVCGLPESIWSPSFPSLASSRLDPQVLSDGSRLCVCRLSTGLLYILWLQVGQEHGGPRLHQALHSGLQGLVVGGNRRKAVLVSVTIAGETAETK